MADLIKDLNFINVGDTITINIANSGADFSLKNLGPGIATGVVLTIELPDGISLALGQSSVSKGTLDEGDLEWTIGSLLAGEGVSASFVVKVEGIKDEDGDCYDSYLIKFTVAHEEDECTITNETFCVKVKGFNCCDLAPCMQDAAEVINEDTTGDSDTLIYLIDNSDNTVELTLDPEDFEGKTVTVKVIGIHPVPNTVTVVSSSGKIVYNSNVTDATDTFTFASIGEAINIYSDGENFFIVSKLYPTPTPTPTSSPTPSVTPTITPTPSITPTETPTPSVTPTVTPSTSPA